MPKVGMQPVRQKQIIAAAIETIHELGIEQSSIRQIGMKAGISPSLITHYFGSRDELYTLVLRHLNRELSRATAAGLRKAKSPMERLLAVGMMRFQSIYERRLASNIAHSLRSLVPADQVEFGTNCLLAMIDGLWVKAAQPTSRITTVNALPIFTDYVVKLVVQLSWQEKVE
jgi:TetR/AcrR family transcriptional regulator, transcriptional repressor of bet genes